MKRSFLIPGSLALTVSLGSLTISSFGQEASRTADDSKSVSGLTTASGTAEPATADSIRELLKEKDWKGAAKAIDELLNEQPSDAIGYELNAQLGLRLLPSKPKEAEERLTKALDYWCNKKDLSDRDAGQINMAVNAMNSLLVRNNIPEAIKLTKDALRATQTMTNPHLPSVRSLEFQLSRVLVLGGEVDAGWEVLGRGFQEGMQDVERGHMSGASFTQPFYSAAALFRSKKKEETERMLSAAEDFFAGRVHSDQGGLDDLSAYSTFLLSKVSSNIYSNPELGASYLEKLNESIKRIEARTQANETASSAASIAGIERLKLSVKGVEDRLNQSLDRLKLIGQDAPEYEAQEFVGMEPTTLRQLRGKVVLLDFWAVWCGPCIATFPHLRDWHEQFSQDGFVILGMTRNYSYKWDAASSRPMKAEDVSNEEELSMLKLFREHHQLGHGFVLTSAEADYSRKLMVSGIPQVVLIDKAGKIRMIKIGSGETNAIELESEIKKLLAE